MPSLSELVKAHSEIFRPLARTADVDFPFYILDIESIDIEKGPRYMFSCVDTKRTGHFRLMLGHVDQRTAMYHLLKEMPHLEIGPVRLEKQGRTWVFVDAE